LAEAAATIFAPATATGRAGVAMLRLSGPRAGAMVERLTGRGLPEPRRAVLRRLIDPATGEAFDRALILWFPGPASFTGEDVVEIHHHGGLAVLGELMRILGGEPGLRLAEPGEFSRRAFLNGRLDLTAAEGLADLVEATTRAQARQALRALEGAQGRRYDAWRSRLLEALSRIEAEIDFAAEEEVPDDLWAGLRGDLEELSAEIGHHLADQGRGERLRSGVSVAVIGAPNVGKSSLVNLLAKRDIAIVTPIAGTTRDVLEVALDLDGLPLTLLDTAGLRESDDPIEAEGVARARRRAGAADLRLRLVEVVDEAALGGDELVVVNKLDRLDEGERARLGPESLAISCATGEGVDRLLEVLKARTGELVGGGEAAVITRARHREALEAARAALSRALALPAEGELALKAEELRLAARAIGRITGRIGVEDILDRIFASFCIGK